MHMAWNSEDVTLTVGTVSVTVKAVVDLDLPVVDYDRGKGILAKGKLLFDTAQTLNQLARITIRGEDWQVEMARKPEDNLRIWFVVKRDAQFTTARSGGFTGGR